MSWQPKTYEVHCCLCGASVSVNFLDLGHIFADKAYVLDYDSRVFLDEKREKTKVDIRLLCENCRRKFGITISPEPVEKEDFVAIELDPRNTQYPSLNVRNDSPSQDIFIWPDQNIPVPAPQFRIRPHETQYIGGYAIGWLQFITKTDPTATLITTSCPFVVYIHFWDASAGQLAPGYPKILWPQFTDGPHEASCAMDVGDRLILIWNPLWAKLLEEHLVEPGDLTCLTLKEANTRMSKFF